ncbi:MAG: DNA topoisomerase IV subunit A [Proteobacteria bacterium]|nr:DNA topoisomerase IV subunit A [Pseudomonadota bacterium]MCP4915560.1 DNA topoisomerase IV subunit A [Pseudomonadota bacterium]
MNPQVTPVALHRAAQRRYLSYALSVITSRALPDVRDGLKPVQRRILYAMFHSLHLRPEGRYRKSAAVVGEVMAKYHPHGDQSIYDAMVRMAQSFSLLHPMVDGQGNFGSLDGDSAAAMRYTECKLRPIAMELLTELGKQTVEYRPNYDGQYFEPVVLPARFPQLLINGSEGIAVGMATRIPPHNLREVIKACVRVIEDPEVSNAQLCRTVKGPDFPVGGRILTSRDDLKTVYETGSGKIVVRGEYTTEKVGRKNYIVITSIPYTLNKATLVERIGGLIIHKKVPQLLDVRDESTEDIRIVLELRKASDAGLAMAYLFKHTPLQSNFHVNLTVLVPTENPDVCAPARLDLKSVLRHWLDFRFDTVRRRFDYDVRKLRERIHVLEGLETIFDCLDEAIRIIRASEGKRDAAEKLMDRFDLDDIQTEAILELKLYKLARLEILLIRKELDEKRTEAARIQAILDSDEALWTVVKDELEAFAKQFGRPRRTSIGEETEIVEYDEDAYILAEDTYVIVTREGWFKRLGRVNEIEKIRTRDGDRVGWAIKATTRSTISFLTDKGVAYTMRVDDVPATTGYGEPVQAQFKFAPGERLVGVISHDKRHRPPVEEKEMGLFDQDVPPPHVVAVTRQGRGVRISLDAFKDVSNKTGRKFMKTSGGGDAVVAAWASNGGEHVSLATAKGRMLVYPVDEVNTVRGAGKGVLAIKLNADDSVLAFELTIDKFDGATVTTTQGREETARMSKHLGKRADRGSVVLRRGGFEEWLTEPVVHFGPDDRGSK